MMHRDVDVRGPGPPAASPATRALADASPSCFWLDRSERPPPEPALARDTETDLAIVGGGFTGLWAALLAREREDGGMLAELEEVGQ